MLLLVLSSVLPMLVMLIVETVWKLKGFPRLLITIVSLVPVGMICTEGYLSALPDSQFFGICILMTISLVLSLVNIVKSFTPSK